MANSVKKKSTASDLTVESFVEHFNEFAENSRDARQKSERDRDYYDHKQLTESQVSELKRRKQPPVVFNRIQPKINFMLGQERASRMDVKAYPRHPKHQDAAEPITDTLRYVTDNVNFDQTSSDCFEDFTIEGTEGATVEYNKEADQIEVNYIPWDRLYWDIHSRRLDFSDSTRFGIVIWKDFADAKRMFPEKSKDFDEMMLNTQVEHDTYEDKPEDKLWVDSARKRVMILQEYFLKDGIWHQVFFCKGMFLREPRVSPYFDEDGNPECIIKLQSCFRDRDGKRYGVVRAFIDAQDEINKRRSKALHILNSNQTVAEKGIVTDITLFKSEKNKPDGHIEVRENSLKDGKFQFVNQQQELATHLQFLQESKAEIDSVGANAALTGKHEGSISGRALQQRQQGGAIEIGVVYDRHRMWKLRIYRAIWARIKQFWTEEKWVRVTDSEESMKYAGLNVPVTLRQQMEEHAQQNNQQIPEGFLNDPRMDQVREIRNQVAEIDIDIKIEEAPDQVTLQGETFELFAKAVQASKTEIPLEIWLELLPNLPRKKYIKDLLQGDEQEARANAEKQALLEKLQIMASQIEMATKRAELAEKEAKAQKIAAEKDKVDQETIQTSLENLTIQTHAPEPNINI